MSVLRHTALLLLMALPAGVALGDSIEVVPEAALEGSRLGLQITLEDPALAPPGDAWIAIGRDKGMRDETAVQGSFVIDPVDVTMSDAAGLNHLDLLSLRQNLGPSGDRIRFSLGRNTTGDWFVGAWLWDDSAGRLAWAGRAPLAGGVTRVDFEWRAASGPSADDGSFRLSCTSTADGRSGRPLERRDLANGMQALNHVRLGVVNRAHHFLGTSGALRLGGFALYREPD